MTAILSSTLLLPALALPARAASLPPELQALAERATVDEVVGPAVTPLPLELSAFLLDHPDLSAFIVRRRGLAPYRIRMIGPRRSLADDGDGTRGVVTLVESAPGRRLYAGEGVHESRLWPDIRASAVIDMSLAAEPCSGGGAATRSSFQVWVVIENRFVSGVVRALRPFLKSVVVRKFTKAFSTADAVSRLLARDPAGVADDVRAFPDLPPGERAAALALIASVAKAPPCAAGGRP